MARTARALFAERGYVATTISTIAAEADIPVQTIYSAFGTKAKILEKVTELWMIEAETTSRAAAYLQEPDPAGQLLLLAGLNRRQLQVGSDVVAIYQEAAASTAEAESMRRVLARREREVRTLIEARRSPSLRRRSHGRLGPRPHAGAHLARGLSAARRGAGMGPSDRRYESWLGATLVGQLLRD